VRLEHKKAMLVIRALEESAVFHGISWGPRIRGRKPN